MQKQNARRWLPVVILILLSLATYWPVIGFDFTTWDDEQMVYANPRFNPPTWSNLTYYWMHPAWNLYMPLTTTTWGVLARIAYVQTPDAAGSHLNPAVFHLANIAIHIAAACVLYSLLRELLRSRWPACAGALLFAVHPLQAETVCWIGGINNQLAGLGALLSLRCYVIVADLDSGAAEPPSSDRKRRQRAIVGGVIALLLATLAKPTAVVVPLLAVVIHVLIRHAAWRTALRTALPWIVAAVPCLIWTRLLQHGQSLRTPVPFLSRPLIAGDALAFYLYKLIWPTRLVFDYGRTPDNVLATNWAGFASLVPVALLSIAWLGRKRWPWALAAAGIFVLAPLPVLGLVPFDFQAISTCADRYVYLAMIGPSLALAGLLASARRPAARGIAIGATAVLLCILAVLAHKQAGFWRDDFSLYPHTLLINPDSFTANNNFASTLLERARPADALPYAQRACQLSPGFALTWINLADSLAAVGRQREAIRAYAQALEIQPHHAAARAKLALALADVGEVDQARAEFDRAVRDDPNQRRVESQLLERIQSRR